MKLPQFLLRRLRAFAFGVKARAPDVVIGGHERPYLLRWFVIPRNPVFNVYLHMFLRSDDDRALHDHPWLFNASVMIYGGYVEHTIDDGGIHRRTERVGGDLKLRFGPAPHRLELTSDDDVCPNCNGTGVERGDDDYPCEPCDRRGAIWSVQSCTTLFITGPRIRAWGFHCPEEGWIHWKRFTATDDPGAIGKGCEG